MWMKCVDNTSGGKAYPRILIEGKIYRVEKAFNNMYRVTLENGEDGYVDENRFAKLSVSDYAKLI